MKSEDISWNIGETVVQATVTSPDAGGTPGVVFVAGSGPTDRNWESPLLPGTNGSARLLRNASPTRLRDQGTTSAPPVLAPRRT